MIIFSRSDNEDFDNADLARIIKLTHSLIGLIFDKEGVDISIDLKCNEASINANEGRIQQALMNRHSRRTPR